MSDKLINPAFTRTKLDEEKEKEKFKTFTIKMNLEEYRELQDLKKYLQQTKDSTALKQLATIGAKVLLDDKMVAILDVCLNNYRKNTRLGIVDFD